MANVTVIDHPMIQHKLTIMRNKETSIAGFRRLLREIAHLMCYEVTRDLELEMIPIETPMTPMDVARHQGQEAGLRLDPARRQRPARRHARPRAGRPRRPYRHLSRPRDAAAGRVLLQGAVRAREPPDHRRRSDARHRQLLDRRHRPAQEARRQQSPLPLPARRARRHREVLARPIPTCRSSPPRSTAISTRRATSSPASATPATACTARARASTLSDQRSRSLRLQRQPSPISSFRSCSAS